MTKRNGEAYRGYYITMAFATGEHFVSKGGFHIYTAPSMEMAKKEIDLLVEDGAYEAGS